MDSRRVEGGPGRERFAVTLRQASNAAHQCLSHDVEGSRTDKLGSSVRPATDFAQRLTPVAGPKYAAEQAEIDSLAETLYGNQWPGVLQTGGPVRHRRVVGGINRHLYQAQFPDWPHASYVAIKDASIDSPDDMVG